MSNKIRLGLEVSPQLWELISDLAERADMSKANLLRKAVALMEVAIEAHEGNKRLGVVDEEGMLEKEVVGICL